MKDIDYISPQPNRWNDIYKALCQAYEIKYRKRLPRTVNAIRDAGGPPTPLIPAGWNYSTGLEKHFRWQDTINWAEKHRLDSLLIVEDKDKYMISERIKEYRLDEISTKIFPENNPSQPFQEAQQPIDAFTSEIISRYSLKNNRVRVSDYHVDPRGTLAKFPKTWGIYLVVDWSGQTPESYLEVGTAGHYHGNDPNVGIEILRNNWVVSAHTLYIGKAGGYHPNGTPMISTLRTRWYQRFRFAIGNAAPAWGGRYLWQCCNSADFYVYFYSTPPGVDPEILEHQLLAEFRACFDGRLPFANH